MYEDGSYDDGYEDAKDEFESKNIDKLDKAIKIDTSVKIDVIAIDYLIQEYIETNLKKAIEEKVLAGCTKFVDNLYKGNGNLQNSLDKKIGELFSEKYPDVVGDKIDEMADSIKSYAWKYRGSNHVGSFAERAESKVQNYIDNELAKEVKKSTDYLEQYSRNYFANNLFRAMGMMDKMMPIAQPNDNLGNDNDK